jgi:hypothetical protein
LASHFIALGGLLIALAHIFGQYVFKGFATAKAFVQSCNQEFSITERI